MRVLIRGRPRLHVGEAASLIIEIDGGALAIEGRVVWRNKVGWRRHIAGLEFVNVNADTRRRLLALASMASNNEYIRDDLGPAARSA
jgi:hypothetical protein